MKYPFWTRLLLYHPAFSGFLCSDSGLTVSPHTKPGLLFNEARPQGEKNNYLFRHRGEESLTPLIYSMSVFTPELEGRFSACFGGFLSVLCSERHSPSAWRGHKCLWHHRLGGQTPWPNYRFPFSFPTYFLALPKRQRSYIISQSLQTSSFF